MPCEALRSIASSSSSASLPVTVTITAMVSTSFFLCAVQRCQPSISSLCWLTSIGGSTSRSSAYFWTVTALVSMRGYRSSRNTTDATGMDTHALIG